MTTTTETDRYERVVNAVMEHYTADRFAEALAIVEREGSDLPAYRSDVAHLSACLRSLSGDPEGALADLQAASAQGGWWRRELLEDDDDLADVRSLPGFTQLVEESSRRWDAQREAYADEPPLVVRPSGPANGVVVALHGAGQDAHRAVTDWAAAVDAGWILVALDSSQRSTPTYRTWPEQEIAAADVSAALGHLTDHERALPVVAGGFSAGGRAALLWALSAEPCPVAGVIAVGPALDDVPAPEGRDLHGVVIVGTADNLVDGARRFTAALPAVRLDEVEGLDHVYPDDFADRLTAALKELAG